MQPEAEVISRSPEPVLPPTLASAREEFIRHMYRHNVASDRPRLLAVVDALIAWSALHPGLVRFRAEDNARGIIRFEAVGSNTVFWAAAPRRENVPLLQILPGSSRFISEETKSSVVSRLSQYTREENPNGNMSIGFGALKNPAGRAAVFELMDELLNQLQPANSTKAAE